jgi:hypothetical protein
MSRIRVTIDRVVLKGIDSSDREPLITGLRAELSQLLANPASRAEWAHSHRTSLLRLGPIALQSGPSGSRKFAGGLARAISRGLRP